MGIVTEYLKYQQEYEEKYGERTIVLYQNGSFFELFEYSPEKNETNEIPPWPTHKIGHATELSKLLGYTLTKRNKSKPYSLENPNMIGFPCVAYEKHKDLLLSKDYTIVIVEQEKSGKNTTRKVTQVLSPATEFNDLSPIPITNQIVSIYIEIQKDAPKFEDYLITVGMSTVDVTTGTNVVGEIYSKNGDPVYALHEIYRFLISIQPRELIINISGIKKNDPAQTNKYKEYIVSTMELNKYPISIINVNTINSEYLKADYHQQFLSKIFSPEPVNILHTNNLKLNIVPNKVIKRDNSLVIEELGLERMHYGTVSYVLLLQYCYEHNELLIEKLKKPDTHWIDEADHLITTHNALNQLNVIPPINSKTNIKKNGINSLLSVVDQTSTSLGKRFLSQIICNPLTNPDTINKYYQMTQDVIDNPDLLKGIEENLKKIPDIERYQRKLQLGIIKPNEFSTLFRGYVQIVKLYTLILQSNTTLTDLLFKQVNDFNECLNVVLSKYNLEILCNSVINDERLMCDGFIFYNGTDTTADQYNINLKTETNRLETIVAHLNSHLSGTRGKLIEIPKSGNNLGLFTTVHKGNVLKGSNINIELCGQIQVTSMNSEVMITSDIITTTCKNINYIRDQMSQYLYRCYKMTVSNIGTKYDFFHDINIFVSKVDYIKSNAKIAIKYNYHRPTINNNNNDDNSISRLEITELRHPVAERLIDSMYVTNDLTLGLNENYGMLLYGANSVGKTTLTKAVGLIIIMAQAGMFVPSKLRYTPYNKIITRLSGEDDLIQGKSSFVIEMSELRTILRNADSRSLVLGDELCRGTESASGTGLTIATITELVNRKTSFIFSTHMHNLVTDPDIISLPKNSLRICHLVLTYDHNTKSLIFDRKLKEGPGESIYGLEVAMSLSIDPTFISKANEVRNRILDQGNLLLNTQRSKYNKKIYMDSCTICGRKPNDTSKLQTHHIKEQSKADKNGFIEHYHKDSTFNLIVLCDNCHKNLHAGGLKLITQETSSGNIIKIQ